MLRLVCGMARFMQTRKRAPLRTEHDLRDSHWSGNLSHPIEDVPSLFADLKSHFMATETLHFENARFAQQLFNHEPRNLQALETELGVKATAREGWIKLDGVA